MWPFRRRSHRHRWTGWSSHLVHNEVRDRVGIRVESQSIRDRSCRCGAIQRHNRTTGEVTIWLPDGVDSGLLDRGLTRRVFEDL